MSIPLTFSFEIDVTTRTEWANIELLRGSIQRCFLAVFDNIDGCNTISMVGGELLENAVNYGSWAERGGLLHLRAWGEGTQVHIQVSNPCKAAGFAEVQHSLRWIAGFPTPGDAYRARLEEIAREPRGTGISKLGLARMSYEGRCQLSAQYDGEIITVTALIDLS